MFVMEWSCCQRNHWCIPTIGACDHAEQVSRKQKCALQKCTLQCTLQKCTLQCTLQKVYITVYFPKMYITLLVTKVYIIQCTLQCNKYVWQFPPGIKHEHDGYCSATHNNENTDTVRLRVKTFGLCRFLGGLLRMIKELVNEIV